jgi:virginiamycin B lyase
MRILLSSTLQSCAVDTDAHVTAASEGRRVWLWSGRKHATTSIRLIQVALAVVLAAAALAGSADVRAQSLFTEFQIPTVPGSFPLSVVEGPDGALWFVQRNSNTVGRMTTAGVVTTYPIPTLDSGPNQIALGPDGNLWFTEGGGNNIGTITPAGVITEYPLPGLGSGPSPIVAGSDDALWFGESNSGKIGGITTTGVITEYALPSGSSSPPFMTLGSDGAVWFTEQGVSKVGYRPLASLPPSA